MDLPALLLNEDPSDAPVVPMRPYGLGIDYCAICAAMNQAASGVSPVVVIAGGIISWNIAIPIYSTWFLGDNTVLEAKVAGAGAAAREQAQPANHGRTHCAANGKEVSSSVM